LLCIPLDLVNTLLVCHSGQVRTRSIPWGSDSPDQCATAIRTTATDCGSGGGGGSDNSPRSCLAVATAVAARMADLERTSIETSEALPPVAVCEFAAVVSQLVDSHHLSPKTFARAVILLMQGGAEPCAPVSATLLAALLTDQPSRAVLNLPGILGAIEGACGDDGEMISRLATAIGKSLAVLWTRNLAVTGGDPGSGPGSGGGRSGGGGTSSGSGGSTDITAGATAGATSRVSRKRSPDAATIAAPAVASASATSPACRLFGAVLELASSDADGTAASPLPGSVLATKTVESVVRQLKSAASYGVIAAVCQAFVADFTYHRSCSHTDETDQLHNRHQQRTARPHHKQPHGMASTWSVPVPVVTATGESPPSALQGSACAATGTDAATTHEGVGVVKAQTRALSGLRRDLLGQLLVLMTSHLPPRHCFIAGARDAACSARLVGWSVG
jgi:hypothetical protein